MSPLGTLAQFIVRMGVVVGQAFIQAYQQAAASTYYYLPAAAMRALPPCRSDMARSRAWWAWRTRKLAGEGAAFAAPALRFGLHGTVWSVEMSTSTVGDRIRGYGVGCSSLQPGRECRARSELVLGDPVEAAAAAPSDVLAYGVCELQ